MKGKESEVEFCYLFSNSLTTEGYKVLLIVIVYVVSVEGMC